MNHELLILIKKENKIGLLSLVIAVEYS